MTLQEQGHCKNLGHRSRTLQDKTEGRETLADSSAACHPDESQVTVSRRRDRHWTVAVANAPDMTFGSSVTQHLVSYFDQWSM